MSGRLAIIVVVVAISRAVEVGGFMEQEVSCREREVGQMFPAYFIRYSTILFLLWLHDTCLLLSSFEFLNACEFTNELAGVSRFTSIYILWVCMDLLSYRTAGKYSAYP